MTADDPKRSAGRARNQPPAALRVAQPLANYGRLEKLGLHVAGRAAGGAAAAGVAAEIKFNKAPVPFSPAGPEGRVSEVQPPNFSPEQREEISAFFRAEGYAVIVGALSPGEVAHLNGFFSRTQADPRWQRAWGLGDLREEYHTNQGLIYSQPLLDHPELDRYLQHPSNYPVVCELLGGEDKPRFAEFNIRETPEGAGQRAMPLHVDANDPGHAKREPYGSPDFLCCIHYLTDVDETTPAFTVVPRSTRYLSPKLAYETIPDYCEQPLFGPAGTWCVVSAYTEASCLRWA
jgi:hypothetical protein